MILSYMTDDVFMYLYDEEITYVLYRSLPVIGEDNITRDIYLGYGDCFVNYDLYSESELVKQFPNVIAKQFIHQFPKIDFSNINNI